MAYGTFIESKAFRIRQLTVPVLPEGSGLVRVLHMSDVHLVPSQTPKREFLRTLADLEPDLVINTGDNISDDAAVDAILVDLDRLLDKPGFFVFGSNDYHRPDFRNPFTYFFGPTSRSAEADDSSQLPWRDLEAGFSARGWQNVMGRRARVTVRGLTIDIRGTDDAHVSRDDYQGTAAGPVAADAAVTIGLTHSPYKRVLDAMVSDGVQLVCAGHTHGGQVCLPGYGALVTNCDLDTGRAKGLSRHTAGGKTAWLHVSAGLGTSPKAPFRFACPPEVTLLTLIPCESGDIHAEPDIVDQLVPVPRIS